MNNRILPLTHDRLPQYRLEPTGQFPKVGDLYLDTYDTFPLGVIWYVDTGEGLNPHYLHVLNQKGMIIASTDRTLNVTDVTPDKFEDFMVAYNTLNGKKPWENNSAQHQWILSHFQETRPNLNGPLTPEELA